MIEHVERGNIAKEHLECLIIIIMRSAFYALSGKGQTIMVVVDNKATGARLFINSGLHVDNKKHSLLQVHTDRCDDGCSRSRSTSCVSL